MPRKVRSRLIPLAAACLLFAVSAGVVQAAKATKSFEATFCFTQRAGEAAGTGDLFASVTWSGYRVDGISIGVGDGAGNGLGFVEPVEPAARSGAQTVSIGVENSPDFVVAGVDIRNGTHVWASAEQRAPNGDWSQVRACP
jgi:hypothetical protein